MKNMKRIVTMFLFMVLMTSCEYSISNKPILDKLGPDELSKAIKSDTLFRRFYINTRRWVDRMDDTQKAKFNELTYRRLFRYEKFTLDTMYWKPLFEKWDKEWEENAYDIKVDSTLYLDKQEYLIKMIDEIAKKKDKLCFDFFRQDIDLFPFDSIRIADSIAKCTETYETDAWF